MNNAFNQPIQEQLTAKKESLMQHQRLSNK